LLYLRARWYDPQIGRFISADPFEGRQRDPRSLNRYVYANSDPVHVVDRSGLMGMMDIGASLNINAINASAAAVGIGASAVLYPHADNAVRTSLWHVMMYGRISHHVPQEAIEEMDMAEQKAKNKSHKPEERHHTVPKFLCGNDDQQKPLLSYQQHQVVHAGLAAVLISIEVSGEGVANTLSIPISRWRKPFILDLGRNELGRAGIANAIGALYDIRGNNFGIPETIGSVFPRERQRFVAGHRHPLCQ